MIDYVIRELELFKIDRSFKLSDESKLIRNYFSFFNNLWYLKKGEYLFMYDNEKILFILSKDLFVNYSSMMQVIPIDLGINYNDSLKILRYMIKEYFNTKFNHIKFDILDKILSLSPDFKYMKIHRSVSILNKNVKFYTELKINGINNQRH